MVMMMTVLTMLWRLHSGCWREREAPRRGGGMGGGQKGVRFLLGVDIGKVCALGPEINFGLTKFVLYLLFQI